MLISKVLDSLSELLTLSHDVEYAEAIDDDSLRLARKLQKRLQNQRQNEMQGVTKPESSQQFSFEQSPLPSSMSALHVRPWKVSEIPKAYPPPPPVLDPTLEVAAFTHMGCGGGHISDLSYERLEWIGDAYIYLTSSLLIAQSFPALLPGKCSQLRERLVKNVTLSAYARHYGFDKRAVLPKSFSTGNQALKDKDFTKILGDIFEAYVAAVILSDPQKGVSKATQWLRDLWSTTLASELRDVASRPSIDNPMWRLRGKVEKVEIAAPPSARFLGSKEELRHLIGVKGVKITYEDAGPEKKDKETGMPLFSVACYLEGWGETHKQLGRGIALGKKDAGNKAAEMALKDKKLLAPYIEKKQLFEAQREAEEAALAAQQKPEDGSVVLDAA